MSKLEVVESEKNYTAVVVKLPHKQSVPGLDNLVMVTIFGNNCLISKDANEDELHIFFLCESVLAPDFLRYNNLYRDSKKNIDTEKKGFFDDHGRVKVVKFKGVTSTGFTIPISSLSYLGVADLLEKDEFHTVNGVEICRKYIKPVNEQKTRNEKRNDILKRFDILIPGQLKFHDDTLHFMKYIDSFQQDDYISITEKYHGTSAILSNVLTNRKLSFVERALKKFGIKIQETSYYNLYASRTVVKNQYINTTQTEGFYGEDIWGTVSKELEGSILKGITIYGEIVGWTAGGSYIQKGYTYGCEQGTHRFLVYRITYTNPDGHTIEFTDSQIRYYCGVHGLEPVKLLWYGRVSELGTTTEEIGRSIYERFPIEQLCPMNNNEVPREGIVIRRDGRQSFSAYKLKSKMFLGYETKMIDEGVEIIS